MVWVSLAAAQPKQPEPEPEPVRVIPAGTTVKEAGIFYTLEAHAKLTAKLKALEAQCQGEKELALKQLEVTKQSERIALTLDLEAAGRKLKLTEDAWAADKRFLLQQIEDRKRVPWYKTGIANFWFGFTLSAVISGLSVWGATRILK